MQAAKTSKLMLPCGRRVPLFLSFFRHFFFSSFLPNLLPPRGGSLPPQGGVLPPPSPCLGKKTLSPMKVCWVCGDSVVFLLYLVGAEEEKGVRSVIKINGKLSKIQLVPEGSKKGGARVHLCCAHSIMYAHVLCK